MNNKDLYNLFAKTDLTDIEPPDFSLPQHKKNRYVRKSMKKIMEYEKSNYRFDGKVVKLQKRAALILISVILFSIMTVSAGVMTVIYFWNPERGIVDNYGNTINVNNQYTVLMSDTAEKFGNTVLSYVIYTEYENSSTLSVWIIDKSTRSVSEKLIKDLYAVTPNGKYALQPNGYDSANGYNYICDYFPKSEKLTINSISLGISTEVTLNEREATEIFVPEIAGYSFVLSLSEDGKEFYLIVIDRNILASEMADYVYYRGISGINWTFWDADGNKYDAAGGGGGIDEYGRSFTTIAVRGINADKIVEIDIPWLTFKYYFDYGDKFAYDIPLPADGETLYGDWHAFDMDGLRDRVDSITRNGDTLILTFPSIALEYNGNVPIFDTESTPKVLIYDENGNRIEKEINTYIDYEKNSDGSITSDCARTATVYFEENTLDSIARVELSVRLLWVYITGDWSVKIK
jgi:hypothetical protein